MSNRIDFEKIIRSRGAIRIGEFVTHAGLPANCKLELDNEFLRRDHLLAGQIAYQLASQIEIYEPELAVPIPEGANLLGRLVAKELDIDYVILSRADSRSYAFNDEADRARVQQAEKIALLDDVFTTGSWLRQVSQSPEFSGRVVAAGVIWDRSNQRITKNLDFPLEAIVERYIPLIVEAPSQTNG